MNLYVTLTNLLGEEITITSVGDDEAIINIGEEEIHLSTDELYQLAKEITNMAEYLKNCEAITKKRKDELKLELTEKYGAKSSKEILGEI